MNTTEMASDPDTAAGHWGNYYCDTPLWMFKDMLLHIKEKHHDVIVLCNARLYEICYFIKIKEKTIQNRLYAVNFFPLKFGGTFEAPMF